MVHVKSLLPDPPTLPPTNIHTFLLENPTFENPDHPDYLLYVDGVTGEGWNKKAFVERVKRARTALGSPPEVGGLGLRPDDMVAIFSENCMDYITLAHALWSLTVPFAPCSAYATQYELAHSLRIVGATYIFVHADRLKIALAAAKQVGIPPSNIIILKGKKKLSTQFKQHRSFDELIKESERRNTPLLPTRPVEKNTLAYILFSSGTTGLPKAVPLSHNNFVSWNLQVMIWAQSVQTSADPLPVPPSGRLPVVMAYLPFYHTFGLSTFFSRILWVPTTVVIIPRWNTELVLRLIPKSASDTSHFAQLPEYLFRLVSEQLSSSPNLSKTDLSSVITIGSGAAYLPPSLAEKISKQVGIKFSRISHGYGLSEATVSAINMTVDGQLDGQWNNVPNSSGALIPGMEARIVREDGSEADYEEPGELWLKGPNVVMGYYRNPKATAETFVDGGWLRTGDRFTVDRKGLFYFQDRAKDTLKVSGMQVSPTEIENTLLAHPKGLVKEVAVAGVDVKKPDRYNRTSKNIQPTSASAASSNLASTSTSVSERSQRSEGHEGYERLPRAWIVLTDQGKSLTQTQCREELDSWVQERLSRYKWLRGGIEFVPEIPKTATGKILRRQLVDKYNRLNQDRLLVSARL